MLYMKVTPFACGNICYICRLIHSPVEIYVIYEGYSIRLWKYMLYMKVTPFACGNICYICRLIHSPLEIYGIPLPGVPHQEKLVPWPTTKQARRPRTG